MTVAPVYGTFPGIVLESDAVRLVCVPDLGGKVISLRDARTGREWLDGRLDRPPDEVTRPGNPFDADAAYGWDECFPSVAPEAYPAGPWLGEPIEDHGELWSRAWRVEAADERSVTAAVDGARFPYTFRRSLAVDGTVVRATYEVENRADEPFAGLWSAHPLLALEPDARLELPVGTPLRCTHAAGLAGVATSGAWPSLANDDGSVDLSTVGRPDDGVALKLHTAPGSVDRASVVGVDGARLTVRWDVERAPVLGIWLCYGGWPSTGPGLFHVALEPTTGDADGLTESLARGGAVTVPPRGTVAWWASWEID